MFSAAFLGMMAFPVALYDVTRLANAAVPLPEPERLALLVSLIEESEPDEIETFSFLLSSSLVSYQVVDEPIEIEGRAPLWQEDSERTTSYENALATKTFVAYSIPRKIFANGKFEFLKAAQFRVELLDGDVLVVSTRDEALFSGRRPPRALPLALAGVLLAVVALVFLNREFGGIRRLAKAVGTINPSDPGYKLPDIHSRTSEVRMLVDAFTKQQNRVSTLLRARTTLIEGIQHDVRTFATRLRLRTEKLPEQRDRDQADTDISDLVALLDEALLAARSEAGGMDFELIDVPEFVRNEIAKWRDTGAPLGFTIAPDANQAQILADRVALRRVLLNVIGNALQYGQAAHVELSADTQNIKIAIDDHGPGIPEEHRDDVLLPFFRLEPSRSRQTGGAGLGLAIVQALVEAHSGHITIGEAPTGGARFTIKLKRFSPDSGQLA